jgi:hypothetical protein
VVADLSGWSREASGDGNVGAGAQESWRIRYVGEEGILEYGFGYYRDLLEAL